MGNSFVIFDVYIVSEQGSASGTRFIVTHAIMKMVITSVLANVCDETTNVIQRLVGSHCNLPFPHAGSRADFNYIAL